MSPAVADLLADAVLILHLAFVLFVIGGGVLVLKWPKLGWVHLPVALWGVIVEWAGLVCPLTPLENSLRQQAGAAGYGGGFIEHYIAATLYPQSLTRSIQLLLGAGVLLVNGLIYWRLLSRQRRTDRGR